jgi:hypothetical protein
LTAAAQGFTGDTTTVPAETVNSLTAAAQTVNSLTAAAHTISWPLNVPTIGAGSFTQPTIAWLQTSRLVQAAQRPVRQRRLI